MKTPVAAYVWSDLYEAGRTEDGHEYYAEEYFVVVQFTDGSRLKHNHHFRGAVRHVDDEGCPHYEDVREKALAAATKLADKVRAFLTHNGVLTMTSWSEWHAEYGSAAYSEIDTVIWEKTQEQ